MFGNIIRGESENGMKMAQNGCSLIVFTRVQAKQLFSSFTICANKINTVGQTDKASTGSSIETQLSGQNSWPMICLLFANQIKRSDREESKADLLL